MDEIYGSTPALGTVDSIMPSPATNVPQGSADLAVGNVVDVEASPSQEKDQFVNSTKSQARDMEENRTGRAYEVLEKQIIVGVGAVNLIPKAEENQQEASKALKGKVKGKNIARRGSRQSGDSQEDDQEDVYMSELEFRNKWGPEWELRLKRAPPAKTRAEMIKTFRALRRHFRRTAIEKQGDEREERLEARRRLARGF